MQFSKKGNSTYNPTKNTPTDQAEEDKVDVDKMIEHVKVLLSFFDPQYQTFMTESGDRLRRPSPIARYEELWYLYPPGLDVYIKIGDMVHAAVVISSCYNENRGHKDLHIRTWCLLFDGTEVKRKSSLTKIPSYSGEEDVLLMDVCPATVWDIKDGGKRRRSFEARGRNIFHLCTGGYKQVYYNGPLINNNGRVSNVGLLVASTNDE